MDAARNAIHSFTNKRGHRTDVDEVVNPAITSETVKPHRHEEVTKAVDREVHQDHYHTTVQPISHREVLPEEHHHNVIPVENREFRHGNHEQTKQNVAAELGQFKNTSTVHDTHHTQTAAPTVTGEHVHHHVHETVQPIINKETIRPEVVHTTIPVHETHHAAAQHHGMSALPMKTLDEFTKVGGVLKGTTSHTHEEYEGQPRPYNSKLQTTAEKVLGGHHGAGTGAGVGAAGVGAGLAGRRHKHHQRTNSASSYSSSSDEEKNRLRHERRAGRTGGYGSRTTGTGHHGTGAGYGAAGVGAGAGAAGLAGRRHKHHKRTNSVSSYSSSSDEEKNRLRRERRSGRTGGLGSRTTGTSGTTGTTSTKPSLMDRLNPMKDTDRDGKKGFME